MIKAVFFDLYQTLVRYDPPREDIESKMLKDLGIDEKRVNVQGGSIALGHPLGATGARLTLSLLLQMKRNKIKYGISSMCIGGGQGMAALFRNPAVS